MSVVRVIDIETSGLDPATAGVIEIGSIDLDLESGRLLGPQSCLVNPGHPIPYLARAVHHISDQDISDAPALADVIGRAMQQSPAPTAFCAHNATFEKSFLEKHANRIPWLCTYKAALRLWPEAEAHGNQVLRYFLGIEIPEDYPDQPVHRALPDAVVTALILREAIKRADVLQLIEWSKEPPLFPRCNITDWTDDKRDKPWPECSREFLNWVLKKANMDADLKWNARRELDHRDAPKPIEAPAEKPIEREPVLVHLPGGREVIHLDVSPENATDEYVNMATRCLAVTASVADLDDWWRREAKHRAQWKIQKGDADYKILAQAFTEHKKKLLTAVAA